MVKDVEITEADGEEIKSICEAIEAALVGRRPIVQVCAMSTVLVAHIERRKDIEDFCRILRELHASVAHIKRDVPTGAQ